MTGSEERDARAVAGFKGYARATITGSEGDDVYSAHAIHNAGDRIIGWAWIADKVESRLRYDQDVREMWLQLRRTEWAREALGARDVVTWEPPAGFEEILIRYPDGRVEEWRPEYDEEIDRLWIPIGETAPPTTDPSHDRPSP